MEARVDIGESDVVLIQPGQKARLEVDAFKDRKFTGTVTEIANSSRTSGMGGGGQSQEATKFEVKIRITEKEAFRPGMSVSTEIETRYRTNALTVPFASVTTRMPKDKTKKAGPGKSGGTNSSSNVTATNTPGGDTNSPAPGKKSKEAPKPIEVVFVMEGDHVKMVPVKIGISDDDYWEITEGLTDGQEVVSGGYKAISRELDDGKKVRKGTPERDEAKEKK
jgi:HlyD family secretion protein